MIRLFIGIPFFHHHTLTSHQSALKKELTDSRISWVSPANFHITLKFIGDTEDYYLNALKRSLKQTAEGFSPLDLELHAPGFFGPAGNPKVIWYGIRQHAKLNELQQAIEKSLVILGFAGDEKTFHAHITLGRVKKLTEVARFKDYMEKHRGPEGGFFHADEFHLFKSVLTPRGAEYSIIDSFGLKHS